MRAAVVEAPGIAGPIIGDDQVAALRDAVVRLDPARHIVALAGT